MRFTLPIKIIYTSKLVTVKEFSPLCMACFCLNLFSTSVASNPALSHNCRGITCDYTPEFRYAHSSYGFSEIKRDKAKTSKSTRSVPPGPLHTS